MHQLPQEVIRRSGAPRGRGWLAGAVLALVALAAATPPAAAADPAPAAADHRGGGGVIVDGVSIPAAEVWQEYAYTYSIREIIHAKPRSQVNGPAFEKAVADVVNRHLLSRAAAGRGIALTDQERAGLRAGEVAAWKGEKGFATALAMLRISEGFVLQRKEMNLLGRKLAELDAFAGDALSEAKQREFHGANPRNYLQSYTPLRYILLPPKATGDQIREVSAESRRLAKAGETFAGLVAAYSRHESAAAGGIVTEDGGAAPGPGMNFAARIKPCRLSEHRKDAAGVHLYARDCRVPFPFEGVRERVRADLSNWLIAERQRTLIAGLRDQAAIEYLPGAREAAAPTGSAPPHAKPLP